MRRLLPGLVAALCLALPAPAGAARLIDIGDFSQPIYLAAPPGDDSRLMVVQKAGTIRVLQGGAQSLFLDVAGAVGGIEYGAGDEQGLFSMAFAPDYATSGRFYVYYTVAGGAGNRVDEFRVSGNASVADPASRREVITVPHPNPQTNHNGGQIAFGPDGFLYIAPGDGAADSSTAQDVNTLLGKVLRIDPRTGATYGVPAGNPYAGSTPGADEVYHRGLRNPFRFSFDRGSGDLIIGDVGGGSREEVTLVPAGTSAGRNFGWPVCEGTCVGAPPTDHFGPALQYSQGSPRAVTGGVVVRDAALPELLGRYIYADFYEGEIRATTPVAQAGAGHAPPIGLDVNNLAAFGQDNGNCVYVVSLAGDVFRLVADDGPAPVPCATGAAGGGPAGASAPADVTAPRLLTRTPRRQRVLRQRGVIAYARCPNESCNLSMSARVRVGRLSYPLLRVRRALGANRRVKVRAKLSARASRALRRARRLHRVARVDVAYRARDAAGNRSPLKRTKVRVRR